MQSRPLLQSACWSLSILAAGSLSAQSWNGYAGTPQHTAIAPVPSRPLDLIRWQMPVDLQPQYSGTSLLIHYGSPIVTAANTVLVPVKTGATDGFRVEARDGRNGALKYTLATDYSLPPHNWVPSYCPALTASNRLYFAGAGGTVYYRDAVDSPVGASGQLAFYGIANYAANPAAWNGSVKISTPITVDSAGNIFFGYIVLGANPLNLASGIARISNTGVGSFVTAMAASGNDATINKVPTNCAPALSNDESLLYFAVSTGNMGNGYLASVNSQTLAPVARIRLLDPRTLTNGRLPDDGTASPMVAPDGDVYYGILENPFPSNNFRGWMLHYNGALTVTRLPGAFGWDDTASLVTASLVPSYTGTSPYLLLTKYNNYAGIGGDGVNKVAILDPNVSMVDPISGVTVMNEVITKAGPTPDATFPTFPNAVREWCINTAVVDPFTRSALVNNEDGILYRWDFATNALIEPIVLTPGIGEAYTPTVVGVDGTVYAINNAILFAVGRPRNNECTAPVPLALGLNPGLDTTDATTSAPAMSCGGGGSDLWYSYTAACTAPHTFDTCSAGTNFNTVLQLYGGTCGALSSIACNDDACGTASSITASLTQGVTYLLRLGGAGGSTGTADIRVTTGTGAGTIVAATTVSTCKFGLTFSVTGSPNIGYTITETVSGATGIPAVGWSVGANIPLALPCPAGCSIISSPAFSADGDFYLFAASMALSIPCSASLVGAVGQFQGFDFFGAGNCVPGLPFPAIPVAASDITTVTLG